MLPGSQRNQMYLWRTGQGCNLLVVTERVWQGMDYLAHVLLIINQIQNKYEDCRGGNEVCRWKDYSSSPAFTSYQCWRPDTGLGGSLAILIFLYSHPIWGIYPSHQPKFLKDNLTSFYQAMQHIWRFQWAWSQEMGWHGSLALCFRHREKAKWGWKSREQT